MNTNDVAKEALIWIEYDYIFKYISKVCMILNNDEANIIYDIYVNGDM